MFSRSSPGSGANPKHLAVSNESRGPIVSVEKDDKIGWPDMDKVGTSYVERQNLTIRTQVHRLTRLTNGFRVVDQFAVSMIASPGRWSSRKLTHYAEYRGSRYRPADH